GEAPAAEPGGAEGAGVAGFRDVILPHDHRDIVAGTAAAEAGGVGDGAISHALCASRRSTSRYSRTARRLRAATQAAASRPRAKVVQIGSRGANRVPGGERSRTSGSASTDRVSRSTLARGASTS